MTSIDCRIPFCAALRATRIVSDDGDGGEVVSQCSVCGDPSYPIPEYSPHDHTDDFDVECFECRANHAGGHTDCIYCRFIDLSDEFFAFKEKTRKALSALAETLR